MAGDCSALRLDVSETSSAQSSIRIEIRPLVKCWEVPRLAPLDLAYRPEVVRPARPRLGGEAPDGVPAQFEDLRAAVQDSRVSPGFVNGLCSDRRLASTLLPHKGIIP
jgi:hypothetical protein